ncbi:hypothetical protein RIF29_42217 [Crotalaria pallida]|uniref:CASP-like protein n=1 Tax=Crotalaria pallida TaxID=3830 RepID=A0AAN9HSC6_CROPI
MASENGEKVNLDLGINDVPGTKKSKKDWVLLALRVLAFLATVSATLVMALNKQTKSLVVPTIGSTSITVNLTAKFQHTPAFVFFVIANGIASLHNLVMIALDILQPQFDYKGVRLALIPISDMIITAVASAGDGGATFMSELGRHGNSHARWDKICDKFEAYCNRGGGALIASFIGIILLLIITGMSITKLLKP